VTIADDWRIGVASYGLGQLVGTRVDGQAVPKSRQQVIGVGPSAGLMGTHSHRECL
jgi:hypothetical protein